MEEAGFSFFGGFVMIEVTDVGLTEAEGLCVSIPG